jgi:hypothetical protein
MFFIFGCLVSVTIFVIAIQRIGIKYPFSKGIGLAIALSILAVVSLAQNYTQSQIPEANDGISISNKMAYWIIGEDGWSQEMFKYTFEQSIHLSLILIAAYPIVLILEAKLGKTAA